MKTCIMQLAPVCALVAALLSCQRAESIGEFFGPRGTGTREPQPASEEIITVENEIWCCGVEVDSSYNWRRDSLYGAEKCHAVLYRDSALVLRIPAGEQAEVGTQAGQLHIRDGHLYTDFNSPTHTIIKCDGQELLRYDSREYVKGLEVVGKDIYTLGQKRNSMGFSFRKNGKVLLERSSGAAGALHNDNGSMCFSFKTVINGKEQWYCCTDGEEVPLTFEDGIRVLDMRRSNGVWCTLLQDANAKVITYASGKTELFSLRYEGKLVLQGCELKPSLVGYGAHIRYLGASGATRHFVWNAGKKYYFEGDNVTTLLGKLVPVLVNCHNDTGVISVQRKNDRTTIEGKWLMLSEECAAQQGDDIALALCSMDDGNAAVWRNGRLTELPLNGYLTEVRLSPPR